MAEFFLNFDWIFSELWLNFYYLPFSFWGLAFPNLRIIRHIKSSLSDAISAELTIFMSHCIALLTTLKAKKVDWWVFSTNVFPICDFKFNSEQGSFEYRAQVLKNRSRNLWFFFFVAIRVRQTIIIKPVAM